MKLKAILNDFHSVLDEDYGKDEVNSFFDLLMDHYLGFKRIELVLNPDYKIKSSDKERFLNALQGLKRHRPIQYIIGETEFYGLPFKVNDFTLIPRPETEELVAWIIKCHSEQSEESFNILDIGTGSGCIPISLAKNIPNANIHALDVSDEALKVAKQNAALNRVEIEFLKKDILKTCDFKLNVKPRFDLIVSNPPYVRNLEKSEIKSNVLEHEPHLALFVDDKNPLQFYKAICEFARLKLKKGGSLYFEINEYLGNEMLQLLHDFDFNNLELRQDMYGKNRMIKGIK